MTLLGRFLVFMLTTGAAFAAPARAKQPETGTVTAVRFWSLGEVTRVAIETDREVQFRAERIENPGRLFVDLPRILPGRGGKKMQVIPVGDALLKQIRIAETQPGTTRIVLDLAAPAEHSVSQLTVPDRLIIELRAATKAAPAPPARSLTGHQQLTEPAAPPETPAKPAVETAKPAPVKEVKPAAKPERELVTPPPAKGESAKPAPAKEAKPEAKPERERVTPPPAKVESAKPAPVKEAKPEAKPERERVTPPPVTVASVKPEPIRDLKPVTRPARERAAAEEPLGKPAAAKLDSQGSRSLIRALGLKLNRVVIDPGHGGHDTGTIGRGGYAEKELVLDVAQRLGTLIEKRLGSEVIYTRSDDTFVPLETRTEMANEKNADLFLSIHANSSRQVSTAGPETFYMNFTTSASALEVAATENASSRKTIHELQDLIQKITRKEKVQESREFAGMMQSALHASLSRGRGIKNRGVKKAPFVVLIGAQMPSILAEICFLSNPREEKLLRRADYRQKIAESLYKGVSQYAGALSHFQVAQRKPR